MACPILHSGGIYVIRHIASSKVYVGSAAKVAQRWRVHRHNLKKRGHHSVLLQRAWHKYGPDAFSWEVVEPVFIASELAAREQFWMDTLSACDPSKGYNIFPKARSSIGRKLTPEQCKAMSIARLGKPLGPPSEEHRRNLSKARLSKGIGKGVPLRTEHKAKLKGFLEALKPSRITPPQPLAGLASRFLHLMPQTCGQRSLSGTGRQKCAPPEWKTTADGARKRIKS